MRIINDKMIFLYSATTGKYFKYEEIKKKCEIFRFFYKFFILF